MKKRIQKSLQILDIFSSMQACHRELFVYLFGGCNYTSHETARDPVRLVAHVNLIN